MEPSPMKVIVKHIDGLALAAKADSGHWVVMDSDEGVGGFQGASKPLELVLMGLGGCTGMDVLSILKKMRVKLDGFDMVLDAERVKDHPQTFSHIRLEYRFYGKNIDPEKVQKAIDLSRTMYCSVSAMLSKAVSIDFTHRILPGPLENHTGT
jgi:putative redox protein